MLSAILIAGFALASPVLNPVLIDSPIVIDGVMDEAAWATAQMSGDLVQYSPQAGGAEFGTRMRVMMDDKTLYFGFEVHTIPETPLNAPLVPRDENTFHNWVGIVIDTYGDGQRGFYFRSSASGVQADAIVSGGNQGLWMLDMSWDGIYRSAAQPLKNGDGYTVELAIPFRSLRYPSGQDQIWRVLVVHFTPTPWSLYTWPELSKEETGVLEQGALLGPFDPPRSRRPFEILPTLTAGLGLRPDVNTSVDPGLGLKVGLTSGLTLDLALNPDFSQIEADPSQVTANLKYALYLQEKRPFFLEGSDYFDTPIEVFYSRSVVDPLLGVRLTGRVGPVPIGVLTAWDQAPGKSTISYDRATGLERAHWTAEDVEGATAAVVVGHTGLELENGTSVGLLVADKTLVLRDGSRLQNTLSGVDATVQFAERWQATGQLLTSQTQLSTDETLVGSAWDLEVQRTAEAVFFGLGHSYVGPDFRAESGFLTEVDRVQVNAWGGGSIYTPPFRFLTMTVEAEVSWTAEGQLVEADFGPKFETLVGERTYVEAELTARRERYLDQDYNLWGFRGFSGINPTPRSFTGIAWGIGPGIDYYTDSPYRGFETFLGLFVEGSLFGRLRLDYSGTAWAFWEELGENVVYNTLLNRLDSTLFMTPKLSLRWIVEHDSWDQQFTSNALLAWQLNHGTAAYLGYQETLGTRPLHSAERAIFAKIGLLYRPGEPVFPGARRRPPTSLNARQAR
jgi:hypothetical protein